MSIPCFCLSWTCSCSFSRKQNIFAVSKNILKFHSLVGMTIRSLQNICCCSREHLFSQAVCNNQPKVKIGIKKRIDDCTARTKKGDFIHVHYKGSLEDGTVFDSSLPRGSPFTFTLGTNQVIKGWEQGLMGMCEGEKRRLVIPPELGYGKHGSGHVIPPNAVLFFEVELMKIEKRQDL